MKRIIILLLLLAMVGQAEAADTTLVGTPVYDMNNQNGGAVTLFSNQTANASGNLTEIVVFMNTCGVGGNNCWASFKTFSYNGTWYNIGNQTGEYNLTLGLNTINITDNPLWINQGEYLAAFINSTTAAYSRIEMQSTGVTSGHTYYYYNSSNSLGQNVTASFPKTELKNVNGEGTRDIALCGTNISGSCQNLSVGLSSDTNYTYYISTSGSNLNNGVTIGTAWRDLDWVVVSSGKMRPNVTVFVINGTYNLTQAGGVKFTGSQNGNTTHPIKITAYNGSPIIQGIINDATQAFCIQVWGSATEVQAHDIIISNLTFNNCRQIVEIRNAHNITLDNLTIYGSNVSQTYGLLGVNYNSQNIIINGSTFKSPVGYNSIGLSGPGNNPSLGATNHIWVTNNTVQDNDVHAGIQFGANISEVYVNNNRLINNTGSGGISAYKGTVNQWIRNFEINNNYFEDVATTIQIYDSENGTVANNTIVSPNNITGNGLDIRGQPDYYNNDPDLNIENVTFIDNIIDNALYQNYLDGGGNYTLINTTITNSNLSYSEYWGKNINISSNVILRNENRNVFNFSLYSSTATSFSKIIIDYTDNSVFNISEISGSFNTTTSPIYYNDRSNFTRIAGNSQTSVFRITKYNITLKPFTNSTLASYNEKLEVDYQNQSNSYINFSFGAGIGLMNLTLNNLTGANYTLGNTTNSSISYQIPILGRAHFNESLSNGAYWITEALGPETTSFIPPNATNLTQTNSTVGLWINYTWLPGTENNNITNSYNVSVNGTWINGSALNWSNGTVIANGWRNITVWAYNNSAGNLSNASISLNTQLINPFNLSGCTNLTESGHYIIDQDFVCEADAIVISAHNISLDGSSRTIIFSNTSTGYGIKNIGYDNLTIFNLILNQGNRSSITNRGVDFSSGANNGNITNITINVSNTNSYGMNIDNSNNNTIYLNNVISNNSISIMVKQSDNNSITSNIFNSNTGNGIYLWSSTNNTFNSNIANTNSTTTTVEDIVIVSSSRNNRFSNTDFTKPRKIDFNGAIVSEFNHTQNNQSYISTNLSTTRSNNRSIINWNISNISWTETSTGAAKANYSVYGLNISSDYQVWNGTNIDFNLTTDLSGVLPDFTINLTTAIKTIKLIEIPAVIPTLNISLVSPTFGNGTTTNNSHVLINTSINSINSLDNVIFNWNGTNYNFYDSSLMLSMSFNNNSAIGETVTNVVDSSKYGNNGTIVNGATWTANGKYGGAIRLDGVNDYINLSNITRFNLTNEYTIEMWVFPNTTTAAFGGLFGGASDYMRDRITIRYNVSQKRLITYVGGFTDSSSYLYSNNNTILENTWSHVAVTVKNGTEIKTYVNGKLNSQKLVDVANTTNDEQNLFIGRVSTVYFNGSVDEVRILNRSLSDDEIRMQYRSEFERINSTDYNLYINVSSNTTLEHKMGYLSNTGLDPVGGGSGYPNIVFNNSSVDYLVSTKQELTDALNTSVSGDIIYINDNATINLTNSYNLNISSGVTLASGRGNGSSLGALLHSNSTYFTNGATVINTTFIINGSGVRLTGIRFTGNDTELKASAYQYSLSRGIYSEYNVEVDNMELFGWSHCAICVYYGSASANIHNNNIHHNQREGLGYGINIAYNSTAIVDANIFDWNRHSISGDGRTNTSFTARYNLVLGNGTRHAFDMHGGFDLGDGTDRAGKTINIFNNTFYKLWNNPATYPSEAVIIRGVPTDGAYISYNHLYYETENDSILQTYANTTGLGMYVSNNCYYGGCDLDYVPNGNYTYNVWVNNTLAESNQTETRTIRVNFTEALFTLISSSILCQYWCYLASNTSQTLLQIDNNYTTDVLEGLYNSTSQKYESHRASHTPNQNSTVSPKQGYFLYLKTPVDIAANYSTNPSITLNAGWNLVGNINSNGRTLSALKTSIGASATQARHFNISSQSWVQSDSEVVPPGESFFVYTTSQSSWGD